MTVPKTFADEEPLAAAWLAGYRQGLTERQTEPPDGSVVRIDQDPAAYPLVYARMGTTRRRGADVGRWYQTGEDGSWVWWEDVCKRGRPELLGPADEITAARAEVDRLYAVVEKLGEDQCGCLGGSWRNLLAGPTDDH